MTYFWDYIFIPLLVTLGLHGLLAYFLATGVNTESYDLTPMPEVNFVEAKLVEAPKPKKPPKTRQPKAAPKPKVEQLATPNAIPEAGAIPTFDTASSEDAQKVEDAFDISTLFETLKEEELLLQEETDNELIVSKASIVAANPQGGLGLVPWMMSSMPEKISINKSTVVTFGQTAEAIADKFVEATTSITLAK